MTIVEETWYDDPTRTTAGSDGRRCTNVLVDVARMIVCFR